jgi:hypothetical protein
MSERCASSEHWRRSRRAVSARSGNNRRRPRCSSKRRSPRWRRVATSRARVLVGHSQLALAAVNGYIKTSVPPSYVPTTPYYECYSASPAALRRCSSSPRPGYSCRRPRRRSGYVGRRRGGRGCRRPSCPSRRATPPAGRGRASACRARAGAACRPAAGGSAQRGEARSPPAPLPLRRWRKRGEHVAPLASHDRKLRAVHSARRT